MVEKMEKVNYHTYTWHGFGFGFFLLSIGLYYFAKEMGWISVSISIWPIILIVLGLYMVLAAILRNFLR